MTIASALRPLRAAALIFSLAFLAGCAPHVRSHFAQPGFAIQDVAKNTVTVTATTDPTLLEFRKSYVALYGTGDSLSRFVSRDIALQLGSGARVLPMNNGLAAQISALADSSQKEKNQAFLNTVETRYLLVVTDIVINQETVSTPQGNGINCVTLFKVDVWDTKSGLKQASFEVDGNESVFFLAFQTALEGAIRETAQRTVKYLQTGHMGP